MRKHNSSLVMIDSNDLNDNGGQASPCVGVLMSTYNGATYLREQIDSIAAQEHVSIRLFIRDDGSTDGTRDLLVKLSQRCLGSIVSVDLDFGENLGFLGSFEQLLLAAHGCDYYAFSDQDDYWLPEKLTRAIDSMIQSKASLYASAVDIVDESLHHIGRNSFPGLTYSIPAEFIRHRLAGHNMVWSDSLQSDIRRYGSLTCWSHDQHVLLAGLISKKTLVFDESSYVLHRRLNSSLTPGGSGVFKRFIHELHLFWNSGHACNRKALAMEILNLQDVDLADIDLDFLALCSKQKRLSLAFSPFFDCGIPVGNAEARLSVLMGRF